MPHAPAKPCIEPGCPRRALSRGSRCLDHRRQRERISRRGDTGRAVYDTRRWARVRKRYLARNPLCEVCLEEGRETLADTVHHRRALKQDGAPYDDSNLQAVCRSCHNKIEPRDARRR